LGNWLWLYYKLSTGVNAHPNRFIPGLASADGLNPVLSPALKRLEPACLMETAEELLCFALFRAF
jgi:hypothetical protein